MITEVRTLRRVDQNITSNYLYFHRDGDWDVQTGLTQGSAYALAIRGLFRNFMSLNCFFEDHLIRHWPDDLSSPHTTWYSEDPGTIPIGVVPDFAPAMQELCVRVDSVSNLGVRYHYFAHVPTSYLTVDVELDLAGRAAYGGLTGLLLFGWIHVSWTKKTFQPVNDVDVLDDLTTHNHRRRRQPTFGPIQLP